LGLFLAEKLPNSEIVALSNSGTQKEFIMKMAQSKGLTNISVLTGDVAIFEMNKQFDRILSIEMFEHMKNYQELLSKVSTWLLPNGKLFLHVFCHKNMVFCY
jgi:cyclopropane-fatty-acyl-phospholipid synthase